MALRTNDGGPITTESECMSFFVDVMKFAPKSSATYAKILSKHADFAQVLELNIDRFDECKDMELEDFLKLKRYIHSKLSSKLPRPSIKMNATQADYDKFVLDWQKYKTDWELCVPRVVYLNLLSCCSLELRKYICPLPVKNQVEEDLLKLIRGIAVSNVEFLIHMKEFMKMMQNEGETYLQYLRRVEVKATHCGLTENSLQGCVKERFVHGLNNYAVRRNLLKFLIPGMSITELLAEALKQKNALDPDYVGKQSLS